MLRGVVRKEIFCESLSPLLRPTTKICEGCSGDFFCSKQTTCGEEGRKEGRKVREERRAIVRKKRRDLDRSSISLRLDRHENSIPSTNIL
jgi:hypothetical protein